MLLLVDEANETQTRELSQDMREARRGRRNFIARSCVLSKGKSGAAQWYLHANANTCCSLDKADLAMVDRDYGTKRTPRDAVLLFLELKIGEETALVRTLENFQARWDSSVNRS